MTLKEGDSGHGKTHDGSGHDHPSMRHMCLAVCHESYPGTLTPTLSQREREPPERLKPRLKPKASRLTLCSSCYSASLPVLSWIASMRIPSFSSTVRCRLASGVPPSADE